MKHFYQHINIGVGWFRILGGQGLEYWGPRSRILGGQGLVYWGAKV